MQVGIVPPRRTACIDREASAAKACRLMREQRLGELVVTENLDGKPVPAGIVSARDIVTRIIAVELDPATVTVGDILWIRARPASPADSVPETVERLCASGGDALPVIDFSGKVAGVVSLDDLLLALVSAGARAHPRIR
jgi:CBS domain-containing protein